MIRSLNTGIVWGTIFLCMGAANADEKPAPTESEKAAIELIRSSGGQVIELAQNDPRLDVSLHLADSKITDENLIPLKNLPRTAILNLRGREITNAGLVHLKDLKGLQKLHLEKTKITDEGLQALKGLENLEYLNLYGTDVSDSGMKYLQGLKKLKKLYLWQTKVTEAGASELKLALPELRIDRGVELPKPTEVQKEEEKKPDDKKPEEKK